MTSNPYEPVLLEPNRDPSVSHDEIIKTIHFWMAGGIAWIATAIVARFGRDWQSTWLPASVFYTFLLFGFYHVIRSKSLSGWKLFAGTFLIWIPLPIHAGILACMVFSGVMDRREFVFGWIPLVPCWTIMGLLIANGWLLTTFYLQTNRYRSVATIGLPFIAASWIVQWLLASIVSSFF